MLSFSFIIKEMTVFSCELLKTPGFKETAVLITEGMEEIREVK